VSAKELAEKFTMFRTARFPFVFANAFTKWIGWRPSEYRKKKLEPSL
jgi:AraC-like DNA-binding protein